MLNNLFHNHNDTKDHTSLLRKESISKYTKSYNYSLDKDFSDQIKSDVKKYMDITYPDEKFVEKQQELLKHIYKTICSELNSERKVDVFEMMGFIRNILQSYEVPDNYLDLKNPTIFGQFKTETSATDIDKMIVVIHKLNSANKLHNKVLDAVLCSLESSLTSIKNPKFKIEKRLKKSNISDSSVVVGYNFSDDSIIVNSKYILSLYTIRNSSKDGINSISTIFLREQGHASMMNSQICLDVIKDNVDSIINEKYKIKNITKGMEIKKISDIIEKLEEISNAKGVGRGSIHDIVIKASNSLITDKRFKSFMEAGASLYLIDRMGSWGCIEATSILLYSIYLKSDRNRFKGIPINISKFNIEFILDKMELNKLYSNESNQSDEFKKFIKYLSNIYPRTRHILNNIPIDTKYMVDLVQRRIEDIDNCTLNVVTT